MGTRSRIGIKLTDGSILSAYHHYDGYPQWLGRQLVVHYNTKDKVSELIDGGDMSVCYSTSTWGQKALYQHFVQPDGTTRSELLKNDKGEIMYDIVKETPSPLYYSERGEDCPPRLDQSLSDFINDNEEFGYVFTSAGWVCYDTKSWSDTFTQTLEIPEGALAA